MATRSLKTCRNTAVTVGVSAISGTSTSTLRPVLCTIRARPQIDLCLAAPGHTVQERNAERSIRCKLAELPENISLFASQGQVGSLAASSAHPGRCLPATVVRRRGKRITLDFSPPDCHQPTASQASQCLGRHATRAERRHFQAVWTVAQQIR